MDISVRHVRQVEVHDIGHARNVDPARGHVGRDQHVDLAIAEALDRAVTLALRFVAVDRFRVVAIGAQALHQLFRAMLGAGEHKRQRAHIGREDIAQLAGLLSFAVEEVHRLGDLVGSLAGGRNLNALGIGEVGLRDFLHLLRHRGREQQGLTRGAKARRDLAQRMNEAEVEHLVGLVEHQMAGVAQVDRAAIHQVDQSARGGDENVVAAMHHGDLTVDRLAADNGRDVHLGALNEPREVIGDLVHQLAGRREDQCLAGLGRRFARLRHQLVDERQAEGQRLAGAGLGEAQHVMARKNQRDRLFLNRGRLGELCACERLENGRGEPQRREIGQCLSFMAEAPDTGMRTAISPDGIVRSAG